MGHDYAVYGAIGAIFGVLALGLVLGDPDGLVAAAIAALATLGGVKIAQAANSAS